MNNNDLFNAMGEIDEDLIERAQTFKKANQSGGRATKRILPVALCLMLAFAVITGCFQSSFFGRNDPTANGSVVGERFGLLVASAAEDTGISLKKVGKECNIAVPYECCFMIERVEGMTTEQKNAVFDKLKEINKGYIEKEDRDIPSYGAEIYLSDKTENSICAVYSLDYFSFAIDNAQFLDKIVISGTGNYSFTKHTSNTCTAGADEGRELTISGEEYRGDNTVGISWNPSYEAIEEFENNESMKVSDITDKLIFTAYFIDGTKEQVNVDIAFDDNGIMNAVIA